MQSFVPKKEILYNLIDGELHTETDDLDCVEYINRTFKIWKQICEDPTELIKEQYCDIPDDQYFCGTVSALEKLKSYPDGESFYGKFISYIQNHTNLQILIGGSSSLAAVLRNTFKPNDIDIYIKNIDEAQVLQLDDVIKSLFPDCVSFIIKKQITLTWIILKNNKIIWKIQLSTMLINEWVEVFSCYHSDIVSLGFEIQKNCFICLKPRWNNFVDRFTTGKTLYFTSIFNCDTTQMLLYGANKYFTRGFNVCAILSMDLSDSANNDSTNINTSVNATDNNNSIMSGDIEVNHNDNNYDLYKYLAQFCNNENFAVISNIHNAFPICENKIIYLRMRKYDIKNIVINPSLQNGIDCPILLECQDFFVKNCCGHMLSVRSFIICKQKGHEINICPFCRAKIDDTNFEKIKN